MTRLERLEEKLHNLEMKVVDHEMAIDLLDNKIAAVQAEIEELEESEE